MDKIKETEICNELILKYPDLKEFKTSNRLKIQPNNVKKILEIITDPEDKIKFNVVDFSELIE